MSLLRTETEECSAKRHPGHHLASNLPIWKLIQIDTPRASQHRGIRISGRQEGKGKAGWAHAGTAWGSFIRGRTQLHLLLGYEIAAWSEGQQNGIICCYIHSAVSFFPCWLFYSQEWFNLFSAFWAMISGPARQGQLLPMKLLLKSTQWLEVRGSMEMRTQAHIHRHTAQEPETWVCQKWGGTPVCGELNKTILFVEITKSGIKKTHNYNFM